MVTKSQSEIVEWQVRLRGTEQQIPDLAKKEEAALAALRVAQGTLNMSKKKAV
jgi:hypothetical protein